MNPDPVPSSADDSSPRVTREAADWLVRRDRGLTPVEQDDYMSWLSADPRHGAALERQARTLERMMQLYDWTPVCGVEPNPDLFAPPGLFDRWRRSFARSTRWWWAGGLGLGLAAAALTVVIWNGRPAVPAPDLVVAAPASFLRVNDRMALPDGSRVELNEGTQVAVLYSAGERRVQLLHGEAHFTVRKDTARPFVVEVRGVEVVAVGTAFNVRIDPGQVEVLVTEGRVRVQPDRDTAEVVAEVDPAGLDRSDLAPAPDSEAWLVSMGERAVVTWDDPATTTAPRVAPVSTEEIAHALAWQAPRLQFHETRLADAVAEFNRLNRHQIELGDPALAELRIGGNFRPDNVEAFVRLLGVTLEVDAETPAADRTRLLRRR